MVLRFPVCLLWNGVQFWARCLANESNLKFLYTLPTNTLGICLLKSLQGYSAHCLNWFKFKPMAHHFCAICWNADLFLGKLASGVWSWFWVICFRFMILVRFWVSAPVYDPGPLLSICFRDMILVLFWVSVAGIWSWSSFEYLFPGYDPGPCGESVSGL